MLEGEQRTELDRLIADLCDSAKKELRNRLFIAINDQKGEARCTPPDANVDMDSDGDNESVVEPLSCYGVVNARSLYARAQATVRGRPLDRLLRRGERVYIMGQTGNWYLLDLDGERG